ncbi:MAG TPA: POTRA domain-containing protein [Terriglobia bacterium]|nr:POTRA domain-containing protein [Terriglobia bacterium]
MADIASERREFRPTSIYIFRFVLQIGCPLLLAWLGCAVLAIAGPSARGQTVVRIELKTDAQLYVYQFKKQIVQQTGEPLDSAKVDESLKGLYATGRFARLRADVQSESGGVVLTFAGKARYYIGSVQVTGTPKPLDASTLVASARLPLGRPLYQDELATAMQDMLAVLHDNAFYQAKIENSVVPNPATQEANILVTITPGPQARLKTVVFQGHPAYPPDRLRSVTNWHPGDQLTSADIEKGLYKIHNFYLQRGYIQASTTIQKRVFDPKTNTENLFVQCEAGPVIEVHVRGADISRRKLRDILPLYQDGVIDQPSLDRGSEALTDFYQQKGYLSARVTVEPVEHLTADHMRITYRVARGPIGTFEGYKFTGNSHLSDATLSSVMTIRRAEFPFQSAAFSNKMLDSNIKALKGVYQSQGFLDAKITPHFNFDYQDLPEHLFVTLDVQEGERTMVGKVEIQGVTDDQRNLLMSRLANRPGLFYSPENEQKDRDSILRYFTNHGYSHASVTTSSDAAGQNHLMNVNYEVVPGNQETIERMVLLGNKHTRDGVVRRELTFSQNQPINESAMLESQRKLYDLGLFNQVQIAPQNPQTEETEKSILISMEEAPRWTLGYGGGIEVQRLGSNEPQGQLKASPRVSLEVSRIGVGGRDQMLSFRGRFSTLDKGADVSYFIPKFPTRRDISVRFSGNADSSRNVLTFTARRKEASVVVEKRWSQTTFLSARYSFRNVQALDLSNKISPEQIPLASRPARIGMFALSYVNDHRDNPVDPTRGSYSLADAGISWSGLGSEANFLRVITQNATYYRLTPFLVFARNTQLAIESPYGKLRQVTVTNPDGTQQIILTHEIPLPERFFLGGSDSLRGFSINQAGPRDPQTGFPIGGNASFLNSLELRFSIAQDRLGVVLFHDMGNVYSTVRKMRLLKVSQSSPTDFDYTVHALGVGFLYKTPVGPLRFDVGYALNPTQYQVAGQNGLEVLRLPRIQYFLSIGQSF